MRIYMGFKSPFMMLTESKTSRSLFLASGRDGAIMIYHSVNTRPNYIYF